MTESSEAVADPAAGGDACTNEFFEAALEAHQTPLLRYAMRLVRDEDAAQDIVQEVFLRLFRSPPREGHSRQISTWLYRVAHNLCIDHIRKESRMREQERFIPQPAQGALPSDGLSREETRRGLEILMMRLSANQRTVLILKIEEGKSYREISEITGLSISNVGFQIHYALKKLAGLMRDAEGEWEIG